MKFRHAAALALVGWYLMVPPLSRTVPFEVDGQAPLREWAVTQAFDKAKDCEDYRFQAQEKRRKEAVIPSTNIHQTFAVAIMSAQCIETTDPRLAK